MNYCRHAKHVTNFHNLLQIAVNQCVSDFLISTVCVAEYTARAMTSDPDKTLNLARIQNCPNMMESCHLFWLHLELDALVFDRD